MIDNIIISEFEGDEARLIERVREFLNSMPKKEIVSINYSTMGIRHYVYIIYKIGEISQTPQLPFGHEEPVYVNG